MIPPCVIQKAGSGSSEGKLVADSSLLRDAYETVVRNLVELFLEAVEDLA